MGKKKKDTMELRFYEVPQGEYVLALLGDNWIRDYGHDESNLHFHNLMEIGYCKNGTGELILNEETKRYEPAMVSIIPQNYPHVTISDIAEGPSYWEYLFFDPMVMIQELYPDNAVMQKKVLQMINRKALFFHEWENRGISVLVKMLMDEATVTQRFGQPGERLVVSEKRVHLLYPEKGLDVVVDADGKELLQYVAPRDFAMLRAPLLAGGESRAPAQ
jgi:hypothetical protein